MGDRRDGDGQLNDQAPGFGAVFSLVKRLGSFVGDFSADCFVVIVVVAVVVYASCEKLIAHLGQIAVSGEHQVAQEMS